MTLTTVEDITIDTDLIAVTDIVETVKHGHTLYHFVCSCGAVSARTSGIVACILRASDHAKTHQGA